jgi:hypothetical protein
LPANFSTLQTGLSKFSPGMLNFENRLTQTGDVTRRPAGNPPDSQGTVAKGPTATNISPKEKALKPKKVNKRPEAGLGARQSKPVRAVRHH